MMYLMTTKFNYVNNSRYFLKLFSTNYKNFNGSLLGIGNPLIDYQISLDETQFQYFISKFGLRKNIPQIVDSTNEDLFKILKESKYNPIITAGGASQNTIRIAQWLLNQSHSTTFIGSVGNDRECSILKKMLGNEEVYLCYQTYENLDTGKCLILVSGKDRALLSNLGASVKLNDNIFENDEIQERFEKAKYVYLEGFLWMTNPSLMLKLIKKINDSNQILCTNLHAEFLSSYLIDSEYNVLENIDILFGNQFEALALARTIASCARLKSVRDKFSEFLNFPVIGTDGLARLAILLFQMSKRSRNFGRIIVFTQGGKEVVLCMDSNNIHVIKVPKVEKENIVDRTGCGDSFVGGFLSALIAGKTPFEAIQVGIQVSQFILCQHGCSIPINLKPICQL